MDCPNCKNELKRVWLICESMQPYDIINDKYGMVENGGIIRKECWNCGHNVSDLIDLGD